MTSRKNFHWFRDRRPRIFGVEMFCIVVRSWKKRQERIAPSLNRYSKRGAKHKRNNSRILRTILFRFSEILFGVISLRRKEKFCFNFSFSLSTKKIASESN